MRTLLGILMLGSASMVNPAYTPGERIELRFSASELGCLTGAVQRLNRDDSVLFKPYPDAPQGRGVIVSLDPEQFKTLVGDLGVMSARCLQQATGLSPQDLQDLADATHP